jgi:cytochrome c oxidase subunit 2
VRLRTVSCLLLAFVLGGCGGSQSALAPRSREASEIATLWWWMLVVASVVFAGAVGLIGIAWLRRRRAGMPVVDGGPRLNLRLVVLFGIVIPACVNVAVFVVANFVVLRDTAAPAAATTQMTVQVVGHQWFWEVRYPGTGVVTANEIHIPVRTRVNVVATTDDVIHSFWVPQLNRKIDMIPGRRNRVLLDADRTGRFRGQCAEFCGAEHARMAMYVFVQRREDFDRWLRGQMQADATAATAAQRAGKAAFMNDGCTSCHTIRGTRAHGTVGPDLTHVGTRSTLAALTLPNNPAALAEWIRHPQRVKPGNRMPDLGLRDPDVRNLVAYLEGLK